MQPKIKAGPKCVPPVGSTTSVLPQQKFGKPVIVMCLDQCQQHDSATNEKSLSFVPDILHEQCFTNAAGVKRHT